MNKRLTSWLSTSNWQSLGHVRHAANKEIGFINIKAGISTMKHFEIITKSVSRALIILLMFGFAFCSNAAVESITYITTDHLGSPIMATDHSGAVKWREDYLPYGSQIVKEDTDNSVGFTGHLDEKTLNVTYMQGRWYHPEMGRFLAVDPVGFVESSPMSFNRYAYVNNNPYKYVDPDGRYLDLAVEALSISVGIASLVDNYSRGDYSAAIVDAGGILVDSVLMAVPIFPGASGLGIKATRDGAQIVTKSVDDIGEAGISAINKRMGGLADGTAMQGKDVSTVLANGAYREGNVNKAASAIRDIAGGHLFKDGNKRTAQALTESLNLPGVSSSQIRNAVTGAGNGTLKSVEDIAKALGGG